jgi:hypothetical protein
MPHEHVNSSIVDATLDPITVDPDHPNGIMRVPERVTVIWNRPAAPHAYADPQDGYVQIVSEQLGSEARFPSPKMIEIDSAAPHAFNALDAEDEAKYVGSGPTEVHCRWCGQTAADGPHGIIDPTKPHLFRAEPDSTNHRSPGCVHCGQTYGAGPHVSATAERNVALAGMLSDPERAPHRFKAVATSDPDSDQDICEHCQLTRREGNHDGYKTGPHRIFTEGEPTWSEPCTGLAVTLTRADLNRLIKMLRRARDDAYGADA